MKKLLILLCIIFVANSSIVNLGYQFEKWPNERELMPSCIKLSADTVLTAERKPVQVLYLIDISQETTVELKQNLVEGIEKLAGSLSERDLFGVILYSEYPRVLFPLSELTDVNRRQLSSVLSSLNNEDGRDMSRAIAKVEEQFSLKAGLEFESRSLFVSCHGPVLQGEKGSDLVNSFKKSAEKLKYQIYSLGYGDTFSEDDLIAIAEKTKGEAYYVDFEHPESTAVWMGDVVSKVTRPHLMDISVSIDASGRVISGPDVSSDNRVTIPMLAEGTTRYIFFTIKGDDSLDSRDMDIQYQLRLKGSTVLDNAILSELPAQSEEVRYDSTFAPFIIGNSILTNLASYGQDLKLSDKEYRREFCDGLRQKVLFPLKSVRDQNRSEDMKRLYDMIEYLWEGIRESNDSEINRWVKKVKYLLHSNRFGR